MTLKTLFFCTFLVLIVYCNVSAAAAIDVDDRVFYITDEITEDEFRDLRQKWRNQLVSDEYDETNTYAVNYVQQLSDKAEQTFDTMNKDTNRATLWTPVHEDGNSAELTEQFKKLHTLTLAYGTKGTSYYKNSNILSAVKSGLDFMVTGKKYNGLTYYGDWWHWQIGVAEKFTEIMMIIYDELTYEKRQQYTNIINNYVPSTRKLLKYVVGDTTMYDISFISTNCRIGLSKIILAVGIIQKDVTKIKDASDCATSVINMVMGKDTYITHYQQYDTGPFRTFHYDLVYYVYQILFMTQDSQFKINSEIAESFVEHLTEVFIPLMYRGELVPPVMGRSVTRFYNSATYTSLNILLVSKYARSATKEKIENAVKYSLLNKPNYINDPRNYRDLEVITTLIRDTSISGDKLPFLGTKMYPNIDRFVQRTSSYMLVLSMYSNRIKSFDTLHGENKRGWHTSDGMLYLYNGDDVQFKDAYWPTIDPYRLPGTTVDTITLEEPSKDTPETSYEKWVGGVANNNQAVIGMSLNKEGTKRNNIFSMNLKAKKSWFVVDGQIIALGAGITGDTDASIETVVDNRLLDDHYNYRFATNFGPVLENDYQMDVNWVILSSDQPTSIGYYFPNGEDLRVAVERRQGCYRNVNELYPNDFTYTGNYRKVSIDHGKHPFNARYAYIILPGINESELKHYHNDSNNKPVILRNSAKIQAVEFKKHNYLGVNIWSETGGRIAGIKTDKPLSLMKQSNNNEDTYVVSDPTQANNVVTIKIPRFNAIIKLSDGIIFDNETYAFKVNFSNAFGASKQFTVRREIANNDVFEPTGNTYLTP